MLFGISGPGQAPEDLFYKNEQLGEEYIFSKDVK